MADARTSLLSPEAMGSFDAEGNYTPRTIVDDDLGDADLEKAMGDSIIEFDDGDVIEGTVVKIDRDEVLLDIGFKSEGVIPARELSIRNDVDPAEIVSLGDHVEALVLQKEDKEGRLVLSKKRAQYERAWTTIEEKKNNGEMVSGPVIEVVKGGLIVDIGLRGFLPASLVELRRVRELQPYVGKVIEAKIIELDRNRNNVVLSRRAWLEEAQKEQRGDFLANLKPGERRKGVVSSVVNFGAFVDLGGMDGLVHVSELSWKHVDHPSSVVSVGDEIEVEVLDVDLDKERISLSLKATQSDPWQEFADSHAVGQLVYGRITKLVPFGAFVQVGDGIEGLVHISEMAVHHVDLPEQVVTPGEELWVKIIDIDLQRRRISLVDQAGRRGWRGLRGVPRGLRRARLRRRGQLHRLRLRRGRVHPRDRGPGGLGRLRRGGGHPRRAAGEDADGNEIPAAEAAVPLRLQSMRVQAAAAAAAVLPRPLPRLRLPRRAAPSKQRLPAAEAPRQKAPAGARAPAGEPPSGPSSGRASCPARAPLAPGALAAAAPSGCWAKNSTGSSSSSSSSAGPRSTVSTMSTLA